MTSPSDRSGAEPDSELLALAHAGYPLRPAQGVDILADRQSLWVISGHITLLIDGPEWELRLYPEYRTVSGADWFRYIRTCAVASQNHEEFTMTDRGVSFSGGIEGLAAWMSLYAYPVDDEATRLYDDARAVAGQMGAGWAIRDFSLLPVAENMSNWEISLVCPYGPVHFNGRRELWPVEYGVDVIEFPGMVTEIDSGFINHLEESPMAGIRGDTVFSVPPRPGKGGLREALAVVLRWPHRDLWEITYDDPEIPKRKQTHRPVWADRNWGPDYSLPSMMRKGVLP